MIDWLIQLSIKDKLSLLLAFTVTAAMIANWKRLQPNLKILALYPLFHFGAVYSLKIDLFRAQLSDSFKIIISLMGFFSYSILAIFFYKTFKNKSLRIRTLISVFLFFVLDKIGFTSPTLNQAEGISSLADISEYIFVIYMCLAYFRQLLRHNIHYSPEKDPVFWVVVGILFYFICIFLKQGLLVFIASANKTFTDALYNAQYVFAYLFYALLILICLIKFPENSHG